MSGKNSSTTGLDEIGDWSIDKLAILKAYADQYALVLQSQHSSRGNKTFRVGYIDGFAGAGEHVHKATGEIVPGSPLNALSVKPRFDEYHLVDLNPERVARLRDLTKQETNVFVHQGDCNNVLLQTIFPKFLWENYGRALCFLDPYGMHLQWEVLKQAGVMRSIEIFLNFPIFDMNRNAKRLHIDNVEPEHRARMKAFWGDESWHGAMFPPSKQCTFLEALGGTSESEVENAGNDEFAAAFQARLKDIAGFKYVPKPVPMRNSKNAIVYYLFFAGNNEAGNKIASHIFKKYRL